MNEEVRQQIRNVLNPGVIIKLKSNLNKSFTSYGVNKEKETFVNQQCQFIGMHNSGDKNRIMVKRDPEKIKKYRGDCLYWSFHIDDIDLTSLTPTEEKIIPESLFDIKNLDV